MLTSISETPLPSSIRTNGLTSLTRINSGKTYNLLRTPGPCPYVSPRPIRINTADIDVSATRFHRNRNARIRSTSPEQPKKDKDAKDDDKDDNTAFMPRIDQNDPINVRATIKRDRNIVRLSTMRQRSQSHSNRSSRDSTKTEKKPKRASPKTITTDNSSGFKKSISQESDDIQAENETKSYVKKSWRDKFGDSLQTSAPKVVRKTPGELILERHIIRDKSNSLKLPSESETTTVRIPENVTSQEITYLEPLIRKSIRRQSLISCPSFKDICKDISSDIKAEDDLNAGDLRRRASLILEQEAHIIAQLTSMRRPSADVTVDEAIKEEPAVPEEETTTDSKVAEATEKTDDKPIETSNVENVIVIKKKTKKKGGKLKHKITVTVEVDNPVVMPITVDAKVDTQIEPEPTVTPTKVSPTWRAVVEEIKEDVTLNLPKRSPTKTKLLPKSKPAEKPEGDFWNLLGRSESTYFKKKVDLKRNEIEIIEILEKNEENDGQVDEIDTKKTVESGSTAQTEKSDMTKVDAKSKGTTPKDISITAKGITDEKVGNNVQLKKNLKNDNKRADLGKASETATATATPKTTTTATATAIAKPISKTAQIEMQSEQQAPGKCENALGNKETIAKQMEIKPMEKSSGTIEKAPSICSTNVENVTTTTTSSGSNSNGNSVASTKTACHEHKQIDKSDVKAPTMMQTGDLNIETGPQANKTTKNELELEKPIQKQKQKQIISTSVSSSDSESIVKTKNEQKIISTINDSSDVLTGNLKKNTTDDKPKAKKVLKKVASGDKGDAKDANAPTATAAAAASATSASGGAIAKPKKKLAKKDAPKKSGKEIAKVKSVSSIESEINAESTDADTSATSESITLAETIAPKSSDHGNDNELQLNSVAGANSTTHNRFNYENASANVNATATETATETATATANQNTNSSVGGLTKFTTVANLNGDFEIERKTSLSNDLAADRSRNEKSTFSTRSIADSCISGDETFDLILDFDSDSDKFSDSEGDSNDEMAQKRRHKKRKEKIDTRKVMKLDPKRKCYITEESSKYPMIATPRPLAKRSNYCRNYGESESESETNSDICSSDECYDECLSPNDVVVKDIIRMSTCSNDSGFEGGGTAPSSPKKMLGKPFD